jgi:hypothetical protein
MRAAHHLNVVRQCYEAAAVEHTARMATTSKGEGDSSAYHGAIAPVLFFNVDAFFEAVRAAHDFLLTCLRSSEVLTDVPSSLHHYCQKPAVSGAAPITTDLRRFWETCGKNTKDYRDCFGHFTTLSGLAWQTALNMKWRGGSWELRLYLPDNPEAKSYAAFSFEKRLDALALCDGILSSTAAIITLAIRACLLKWGAELGQPTFTIRNVVVGP